MMMGVWACGYGESFCCGAACDFALISPKPSRPLEMTVTDFQFSIFNSILLFGEGIGWKFCWN